MLPGARTGLLYRKPTCRRVVLLVRSDQDRYGLGQGVAVFKDKAMQERMNRLQFSSFSQQTTWEYFCKVLKSLVPQIIADLAVLYSAIALICSR